MKNKFTVITVCIFLCILGYFSYKSWLLINYRVEVNDKLLTQLNNLGNLIEIKFSDIDKDLIEFKNVTFALDNNFEFDEEISNNVETYDTYYFNNEDTSNYIAIFKVGKTYSLYDVLVKDNASKFDFDFKGIDRKEILKKYNLNNDYEIFRYIVNHYKDKSNIFSKRSEIEMNYLTKTVANTMIPLQKINLIEGDYKGYMYSLNNLSFEVHLINNDENYWFGFINNINAQYFNLDKVKDFISNIKFK